MTEVGKPTPVGEGEKLWVMVNMETSVLRVDDCSSVTTGGIVDWTGCDNTKNEEELPLVGIAELEQLAKSVEVGLTTVMKLGMIKGSVTVKIQPVHASTSQTLNKEGAPG